jgi:hypothetical protein
MGSFVQVMFSIKLRETKHIRGIEIKLNSITGNLKICQLADDTTLFLKTKAWGVNLDFGSIKVLPLFDVSNI